MPEGFEDEAAEGEAEEGEEEGEGKKKNEIIYLAGRIFREEPPAKPARAGDETPNSQEDEPQPKWIYEKWNQAISTSKYPQIEKTLADLHFKARN